MSCTAMQYIFMSATYIARVLSYIHTDLNLLNWRNYICTVVNLLLEDLVVSLERVSVLLSSRSLLIGEGEKRTSERKQA